MTAENPNQTGVNWRILYPFASHWHSVQKSRLHFVDEGPSPSAGELASTTLLFVHGNPTWSFHWRRLIVELRNTHRCVAPDHLGCGLSDKPPDLLCLNDHITNLDSLVESLDLQNITLIAQDWGGAIGLGAALRRPERIERIILFNTGAFPPPSIPFRIRVCRWPVVGRLAVQGANVFSRAAQWMTLARTRRLEPAIAAGYLAPYNSWANRLAVYGFVKDIPTSASDPTWQTLAEIERRLPTFADRPNALVWGMQDWCFGPHCLEKFVNAWPAAEVHRLANVGHWVVEDAPDEALSIVKRLVLSGTPSHA